MDFFDTENWIPVYLFTYFILICPYTKLTQMNNVSAFIYFFCKHILTWAQFTSQ